MVVSITKEDPLGGPRSDRDVTLQVDDARLDSNAEVFRTGFNDSLPIFNMERPLHLKTKFTKFTFLSFLAMNSRKSKINSEGNPRICAMFQGRCAHLQGSISVTFEGVIAQHSFRPSKT